MGLLECYCNVADLSPAMPEKGLEGEHFWVGSDVTEPCPHPALTPGS
jgi:hypothetical protein